MLENPLSSDCSPKAIFHSISESYSIGDTVELSLLVVGYIPSLKDWIGMFLSDQESCDKPLCYEFISLNDTLHTDSVSLSLKLDFPVKEDLALYDVRYITENNATLGKTESFKISLVPYDESESVTILSEITSFGDEKVAAEESIATLLLEIERRELAEKAVENLSRKLGEQMNFIDSQNEIVSNMCVGREREKCLNDALNDENKELQEQADFVTNELKKTQNTLLNYKSECCRLNKELENTDRENSCLKFQIVNSHSEERLENEKDILIKIDKDADAWNECKTLTNNIELLEQALEKERCKVKLFEEEVHSKSVKYELGKEEKKQLVVRYEVEINRLKEELNYLTNIRDESIKAYETKISEIVSQSSSEIGSLKGELDTLIDRSKVADQIHERSICDLKIQYASEITSLKEELETVINKCKESDQIHEIAISVLKSQQTIEMNTLKGELDSASCSRKESDKAYEKTIDDLESRVANESSNASRLENDLTIAELRCRESEDDVKFFRQQLLDTEGKLQSGQTLLSKTLEEMNNLKNTLRRNTDISNDINRANKYSRCGVPPVSGSLPVVSNVEIKLASNTSSECINVNGCSADVNISSNRNIFEDNENILEQPKMTPGIVKFNPNSQKASTEIKNDRSKVTSPQPISVILDPRRVPRKGRRRYSKPINLAFTPLNTVAENDSDTHQITLFSREVNELDRNQLENQYDAIRQHRNSLIRENTYLKNKVTALVTDLLLLQKNLQDVIMDAEQKVGMLQLLLGNQYLAALTAQNDLQFYPTHPNPYQLSESPMKMGNRVDTCPPNYLSSPYGMIQSPIKNSPIIGSLMNESIMNESQRDELPVNHTCPSNYLSPHAEEYTPTNAVQHNSPGGPPSPSPIQDDNTPVDVSNPDLFLDYIFNNVQNGYALPFPPPLPLTPPVPIDESLVDVTRQLEGIGIHF